MAYRCTGFQFMGRISKKIVVILPIFMVFLILFFQNQIGIKYPTHVINSFINQRSNILNTHNLLNNVYNNSSISILNKTANQFVFKSYDLNKPPTFNLHDEENVYFIHINGGRTCFIQGTDLQNSHESCICKAEYFGKDCGIPAAAWFAFFQDKGRNLNISKRAYPRRVLHGMQVSYELDMFETRLHELYNTVDFFVIVEANHTDYGDPKPLVFLERLKKGYLGEFQNKIVHVYVSSEPPNAKEPTWRAHDYMRSFLGPESLSRINGIRDDDLFIVSDADEIPSNEIITFLKLYDGYYEHVCFRYRWNIYGFFWKQEKGKMTQVCSVSSIKILREKFSNNTWMIRPKRDSMAWWAGTVGHYAGWHCSWCFSPSGIVRKLDSAQAADRPRWGDYPEKKNLTYIQHLINEGRWFDDKGRFAEVKINEPMYAPKYLMENYAKYKTMLFHPKNISKSL
ncbi:unnamed protein product, partial [Meganyctiphanes norvegica]